MTRATKTKHAKNGNCMAMARSCPDCSPESVEVCDICHEHEQPRGDCDACAPCDGCERHRKASKP